MAQSSAAVPVAPNQRPLDSGEYEVDAALDRLGAGDTAPHEHQPGPGATFDEGDEITIKLPTLRAPPVATIATDPVFEKLAGPPANDFAVIAAERTVDPDADTEPTVAQAEPRSIAPRAPAADRAALARRAERKAKVVVLAIWSAALVLSGILALLALQR